MKIGIELPTHCSSDTALENGQSRLLETNWTLHEQDISLNYSSYSL